MLTIDVTRLQRLVNEEAWLRANARDMELDPNRAEEARVMFKRATKVREERLELMDRCGLTR